MSENNLFTDKEKELISQIKDKLDNIMLSCSLCGVIIYSIIPFIKQNAKYDNYIDFLKSLNSHLSLKRYHVDNENDLDNNIKYFQNFMESAKKEAIPEYYRDKKRFEEIVFRKGDIK